MALSGWNAQQRFKLTVDGSKIDEDLTDFPVNITLSSGTGITGFDTTDVFDKLYDPVTSGSYANRHKIVVTDSNDNKLYTEIAYWDHTDEEASLWTKVPTLSSGTNSDLFLYYDATVTGTSYTGDTGSTAAENVWDSNFQLVCHFEDAATDSTVRGNDGTITGADETSGLIFDATSFPDTADKIAFPTSGFNTTNTYTVETIVKPTAETAVHLWEGDNIGSAPSAEGNSASFNFWVGNSSSLSTGALTQGEWQNIVARYDKSNTQQSLFVNNVDKGPNSVDVSDTFGSYFYLGNRGKSGSLGANSRNYGGSVDELRVSSTARSDSWLKATYYSNWNDLITFDLASFVTFVFSNAAPSSSTVYGTTHPLYINVTISGSEPSYVYDAYFYDGGDAQIGTTVSAATNGSQVTRTLSTPSGASYSWYVTATASGFSDTSETYSFDNRFLCSGYTMVNGTRTSGIPVRLYRRADGSLIGNTTSAGVSGTFEIESLYNEQHYAVAIHSNEEINALIFDHIAP